MVNRQLSTVNDERNTKYEIRDWDQLLLAMLAYPSVASKEGIVRRYDHEVRGGTLVRPFNGPHMDGPADAAVLKPLGTWEHDTAFALSCGVNPMLGSCDPYAMAISAVDEAVRNAVAVGADPDRIAILDNFCWGNPTYPDRLGSLVRTCQGCYDAALAYHTPFISGKDSLFNEFNGQPIPGTLLISAIAIVPDMHRCVTMDFKTPGNLLFLLGETRREFGGSLLHHFQGLEGGAAPTMPENPLARYQALHQAIRRGLIQSCHDLSEGGLAVALAEMCMGGRLGAEVELERVRDLAVTPLRLEHALFAESNGRLLLEVRPEDAAAVGALLADAHLARLGEVTEEQRLLITAGGEVYVDLNVDAMVAAWKRTEE